MTLARLSEAQIQEILDLIGRPRMGTRLLAFDADPMSQVLRPVRAQLEAIQLKPEMFEKLRDTIVARYHAAIIAPRTALGVSAAHANIEPVSQAVLKMASDASRSGAAANMNNSLEIIETTRSPKNDWISFTLRSTHDPTYCEIFAKNMIENNLGLLATDIYFDTEGRIYQGFNTVECLRRGLHPIEVMRQFMRELEAAPTVRPLLVVNKTEIRIHVPGISVWALNKYIANKRKKTVKHTGPHDYQITKKNLKAAVAGVTGNTVHLTGPIAMRRAAVELISRTHQVVRADDVDIVLASAVSYDEIMALVNKPWTTIILSCPSSSILDIINKYEEIDLNTIMCADMNVFTHVFGIGTTRGCFEQRYVDAVPPDDLPAQIYVMMVCNYVTGMGPVLQKVTRSTVSARGPLPAAAAENPVGRFYAASLRGLSYATTDTTTELMLGIPPTQTGTSSVRLVNDPVAANALFLRSGGRATSTVLPTVSLPVVDAPL